MLINDESIVAGCQQFMRDHAHQRLLSFNYFDNHPYDFDHVPDDQPSVGYDIPVKELVFRSKLYDVSSSDDALKLSHAKYLVQLRADLADLAITKTLQKFPDFAYMLAEYLKITPPILRMDSYNEYQGAFLAAKKVNGFDNKAFYDEFFRLEVVSIICGAVLSYQLSFGMERLRQIDDGRLRRVSTKICNKALQLVHQIALEGFQLSDENKSFLDSLKTRSTKYLEYAPSEEIRTKLAVREIILLSGRFEYRRSEYLSPKVFNIILGVLGICDKDPTTIRRWRHEFRGLRSILTDPSYFSSSTKRQLIKETLLYTNIGNDMYINGLGKNQVITF